ncbi:MAG: rRNA maturation RNase YbeY [Flavobacteriales bacterium]|nr:rRNA maturation RNase YbeY [Flavobacteriales bacterium]|tara:strand:+ start:8730 stop:9143 length:414 start_codon:yes stop_codon:yes gene_type:complete
MIEFHWKIKFKLKNQKELQKWIELVIISENKTLGDLNYIFCSDEYLLERNIKYLKQNTLTDIITFNYCEGRIINSDIMISIDRIKENSIIFENSFSDELHRVMIHGVLHLIGYDDQTTEEKKIMREKENFYLKKLCI